MKLKWNRNSILGITDRETVKLDFDNRSFQYVLYWARWMNGKFRLNGFVVLKSSENHYHVVFNRKVSWSKNVKFVAWLCLKSKNRKLTEWLIMQLIKEGSTLRVSPKKGKAIPRVVFRFGCGDGQVEDFLRFRRVVKRIICKLCEV